MYGGYEGGGRGGPRGGGFVPVNVGDEVDVNIEAVGEKGDGVAKIKGFVLFVPGAKQGENIRVKVTKVLKSVGFADKIGEAQGPIEKEEPRKRKPSQYQEASQVEPEPELEEDVSTPEDTEDFGEEPEDDIEEEGLEEDKQ